MLSANYFFTFKEITIYIFALLAMKNFVEGNVRALILWPILPAGMFAILISVKFLKESPRFLHLKNRADEDLDLIYKIVEINQLD